MFGSQRQDWKNVPEEFCYINVATGNRYLELFLRGSWLNVGLQCLQRATATI